MTYSASSDCARPVPEIRTSHFASLKDSIALTGMPVSHSIQQARR